MYMYHGGVDFLCLFKFNCYKTHIYFSQSQTSLALFKKVKLRRKKLVSKFKNHDSISRVNRIFCTPDYSFATYEQAYNLLINSFFFLNYMCDIWNILTEV